MPTTDACQRERRQQWVSVSLVLTRVDNVSLEWVGGSGAESYET